MRSPLFLAGVLLASCRGQAEVTCPSGETPIAVLEGYYGKYGTLDYRWTYTYDDDGRPLRWEDFDGHFSSLATYTYEGNVVTMDYDEETDGVLDGRRIETYDDDGNVLVDDQITYETDPPHGDPHHAYETITTYTYDDDGNVLTAVTDMFADGTVDTSLTYTYDEHGSRLSEVESGGGAQAWTYTYDDDGNVQTVCDDANGCWTYVYDEAGTVQTALYENADGSDTVTDTLDGCGHLLTELREGTSDWDGDGTVDWRDSTSAAYTYDEEGNVLKYRVASTTVTSFDYDGDGTLDVDTTESTSSTYTYRYTYAE